MVLITKISNSNINMHHYWKKGKILARFDCEELVILLKKGENLALSLTSEAISLLAKAIQLMALHCQKQTYRPRCLLPGKSGGDKKMRRSTGRKGEEQSWGEKESSIERLDRWATEGTLQRRRQVLVVTVFPGLSCPRGSC